MHTHFEAKRSKGHNERHDVNILTKQFTACIVSPN